MLQLTGTVCVAQRHSAMRVEINPSSFLLQGEIHRVKSDGTNRTEFAPAAILGSPVGLALDWLTENLYYTNPATQSIEVRQLIQIILCSVVVFFLLFTLTTGLA